MSTPACADDIPQPLIPLSGTCGVDFIGIDCDLYWSPSHSDDESPPPVKRRASALNLCHRCGMRPIAESRCSDLDVCGTCDQYLWWLDESREAQFQKFLDKFHASESGNRSHQMPSADQHNVSAESPPSVYTPLVRHTCRFTFPRTVSDESPPAVCVCGYGNAQSCPRKENHYCLISSPGRQHACATLISENTGALESINACSKRLKTACAALDSSDLS